MVNDRKVAVVGCGFVGSSSAFALMQSGLFSEMVLIDVDRARAEGEALDIAHGVSFGNPMKIYAGDYSDVSDAAVIVVTAGAAQKPGETRLDLVNKNISIFGSIIPQILCDDIMEVRAVAGDNYLGGEDFTELLLDMFLAEHHMDKNSLSEKERLYYRNQAEKCKCSGSADSFFRMQAVRDGRKLESLITKREFEKKAGQLFDRIRQPVRRSLADAGVRISEIDEIVLVGGATKMPAVRKFVGKLFGRLPDTSVNPDEAVALGAAIQGAMKERRKSIREVILTDVCPFTLGTEVSIRTDGDRLESNHFCPILERNTVIPASRTEKFYTVYDHQ